MSEKTKNSELASYVKSKPKQVTTKDNLIDWLVYTVCSMILLIPFFQGQYMKHVCASLLIGFLFGMLNRIIREIFLFREDYYNQNKK
jgi:hypothetical protein